MQGFIEDVAKKAKENTYFRQVLETGMHTQIVIMSIPVGGEIGEEVHDDTDQVLYIVEGEGRVVLNGEEKAFKAQDIILVKSGVVHNFINTDRQDLKIITMYSPPHHPAGIIHKTKEEAALATY